MYIIGDVHGCINTLKQLVQSLRTNAKIVFVGDLVDRGDSKAVIQFVRENNYDCVLGNHEVEMAKTIPELLKSKYDWETFTYYADYGGKETLQSYGINSKEDITSAKLDILNNDIAWIKSLPLYLEYKDIKDEQGRYLVVSHASINEYWHYRNTDMSNAQYGQFQKHTINNRDTIRINDIKEIYNVFGHTPRYEPLIEEHYAMIDTGCFYKKAKDMYATLSALEFPSKKVFQTKNIEDES